MLHPEPSGKGAKDLYGELVGLDKFLETSEKGLHVPLGGLILSQALFFEVYNFLGQTGEFLVVIKRSFLLILLALPLPVLEQPIGGLDEPGHCFLVVDPTDHLNPALLLLDLLAHKFLDAFVLGECPLGVLVHRFLLLISQHAISSPQQQQADDF